MSARYLGWLAAVMALVLLAERLPLATQSSVASAIRPGAADAEVVKLLGRDVRLVDLTHAFDERTIYWPTEIPFHLDRGFAGLTEGGWYYSSNRFSMAEHSGTHVDAPIHFFKDGQSVDEIPLTRLFGPAVVVDVSRECRENADLQVTADVFQAWEKKHGRRLDDAIVLVRTGFGQFWPDRRRYLGTDENGRAAVAKLHFPGVHPEGATWLAENRRIKAIGIDTASIDYGQTKTFGAHVALCSHNIPAFENVANLAELPEDGFSVAALPMKIRGGSGGPLRIVAIVPK